jgi:divinyl protochlorophyllide a 8-vinyl-reductase
MSAVVSAPSAVRGRIGPNAITRVAEVLPTLVGDAKTRELFDEAGISDYLSEPPQQMVDESEVASLHGVLRSRLGAGLAGQVSRHAGLLTADYLLVRRIPKPVQSLLKVLPAPLAARVLLSAIRRHAWTFAGSGHFVGSPGTPVCLTIRGNPMCRKVISKTPACDFYAATFELLFRVLVHPKAQVIETHCEARGDAECRFEVHW